MNNFPFYPFSPYANPYFPKQRSYPPPSFPNPFLQEKKKKVCPQNPIEEKKHNEPPKEKESPLFEILGIPLFYDDILLLCLILFLYLEGIQDTYLFLALLLLLLS